VTQAISEVLGETTGVTSSPFDGQQPAIGAAYAPFSFTAKRFMLHKLAERAGAAVPRTDFSPVLKNFLVRLRPDSLSLTATDLELAVIASTTAVTAELPGDVAELTAVLPAKRLIAILAEAPEGDVTISVSGDQATVTAGPASWVLHLGSDGKDYPQVAKDISELQEVPRRPLLDALRTVRYAVSKTSPELAQVSIAPGTDGVMCVTACDRNRLARVLLKGFPVAMRIPTISGAVDALIKLLSDSEADSIKVATAGSKLVFSVGSVMLIASRLGKEFPDVEKLLLAPVLANDQKLTVDRAELRGALRRVRINADATTSALSMQASTGKLTLTSRDTAGNKAQETIVAAWDGPSRSMVINHGYLDQMLAAHPAPSCVFALGKDVGKRRTPLLLADPGSGTTGVITQMSVSKAIGY